MIFSGDGGALKKERRIQISRASGKCRYCPPHKGENRFVGHSAAQVRDRRLGERLTTAGAYEDYFDDCLMRDQHAIAFNLSSRDGGRGA